MADAVEEIVEDACANCGERVVLVEYIKGVQWMHQPEDVKDREDMMHLYCKVTVAASSVLGTTP